jgi:hypothetical protein
MDLLISKGDWLSQPQPQKPEIILHVADYERTENLHATCSMIVTFSGTQYYILPQFVRFVRK